MRKGVVSLLLILLFTTLLIPNYNDNGGGGDRKKNENEMTAAKEIRMKQSLLQQDLNKTDLLCRAQCTLDYKRAIQELERKDISTAKASMEAMKAEHHHMNQLVWMRRGTSSEHDIKVGSIPGGVQKKTESYMKDAKQSVAKSKMYQSPPIKQGNSVYFVLGVPSDTGQSSLIGVVQQDVLDQVKKEQRKNLRIVPYPSDKRVRIKSVDSDTLRDVKVEIAEDNEGTSHYMNDQVVVKFRKQPSEAELAAIQAEIKAATIKKLGYTYVFQSEEMKAKQLMKYFKRLDVEYVEPHFLYLTNQDDIPFVETDDIVPNDALFRQYQWNLPIIETNEGWRITKGSEEIIVAVVDTGADLDHPDLRPHLVEGVNIIDDRRKPIDDVGHGTHVAGVIAALVNNAEGVAGMTWYNRVMPIKVLDETGAGSTYAVAQGIIWATDHGAKVINLSLGNYVEAEFLHDAVKYAFDKDVVLIAATGNDNTEQPGYPAAYPEVFAVSATDINKERAVFSNYGSYIDVMAPGVSIASTYPHNQYAALSGTSMASPHVAALAALIRSVNPLLKNTEVMEIMRSTAEDLGKKGRDNYFGFGQVDVVKAVSSAEQRAYSLTFWSQFLERELEQIKNKYKKSSNLD